jgi:hypothetical protein
MEDIVTKVAHATHGAQSRKVSPLEVGQRAIKAMLQSTEKMLSTNDGYKFELWGAKEDALLKGVYPPTARRRRIARALIAQNAMLKELYGKLVFANELMALGEDSAINEPATGSRTLGESK